MSSEQQYLDLLKNVLENGTRKENRTGTDTIGILGAQCRYDLNKGFPLFTTKRVWMKGVVHELLWFLSGSTNIKYLVDNGVNIWNDDAYRHYLKLEKSNQINNTSCLQFLGDVRFGPVPKEEFVQRIKYGNNLLGDLGPVYGEQWRKWKVDEWQGGAVSSRGTTQGIYIDQIANLIDGLWNNPQSRRHILTAWNVADIDKMGLPPCHVMAMFSVVDNKLSCHMIQRSCDLFLGVPFNVASYSLLTHMIAQVCDLGVGDFIHTLHDAHIYVNHIDAVKEQLDRGLKKLPELKLNPEIENIDDFKYSDIKVEGYNPHPTIKAELVT